MSIETAIQEVEEEVAALRRSLQDPYETEKFYQVYGARLDALEEFLTQLNRHRRCPEGGTMKISDLVLELEGYAAVYGDVEVKVRSSGGMLRPATEVISWKPSLSAQRIAVCIESEA